MPALHYFYKKEERLQKAPYSNRIFLLLPWVLFNYIVKSSLRLFLNIFLLE